MELKISLVRECDADTVFEIQRAAFRPLYEKYHDDATSPYLEDKETVLRKYTRADSAGYLFFADGKAVGAVRINLDAEKKAARVSALCVLPEYRNIGVAQTALRKIEALHPEVETWSLDTILEEPGNCYLYEKLGYRKTGKTERIHENMTLVCYEKKGAL